MKKFCMSILLLLSLGSFCMAAEKKVEAPAECKQCGMDRTVIGHSRMMVTYADGSKSGTCSINCAAKDMKDSQGKEVKSLQVGDYNSKKLIDARTSFWVIGGKKQGVMTPVAKWAFADKKAAAAFIKENGGKQATFGEALKAAEKELAENDQHKSHGGHKM